MRLFTALTSARRPAMGTRPATWAPPLAAAGAEGEWLVARVRLIVTTLLLVTPTYKVVLYPSNPTYFWGFLVTATAWASACLVCWTLRRYGYRPWLGASSSFLDVSFVSGALAAFLYVSSPLVALNSKDTFEMYFLAILATSLRYDRRICLSVGAMAIAQYAALWTLAALRWDLRDPRLRHADAGPYNAVDQVTRILLLGAAVLLADALVKRAQRLLHLSVRDRMTGLFIRAHWEECLDAEIERARRYGRCVSVALLDVDHFKRINDTYGHAAGDAALQVVARALAANVRQSDVVARYGGEEFAILFPETSRSEAASKVDALRRQLESLALEPSLRRDAVRVSFSAGVAGMPEERDWHDARSFVGLADARLLEAKRSGRNRVVASDEPEGPVAP